MTGIPSEAFGASPILVKAVHHRAASWHDSSSLTATITAVGQVKCHGFYHRFAAFLACVGGGFASVAFMSAGAEKKILRLSASV